MKKNKTFNYLKVKTSTNTSKSGSKWVIVITLWTFILSIAMNVLSNGAMPKVHIIASVGILLFIIFIGIIFDILGTAVAAASETPFHSMASRKVKGAKNAIFLIRNAEKVASFCNDVIGDISGIISGGATAIIVVKISSYLGVEGILLSFILTGFVASLTVGGKAIGKGFALRNANTIVYIAARIISVFTNVKTKEEK